MENVDHHVAELLERVDELARIDAALADLASGGRGSVIAIQGDAGSGRSALLAAARALAAQRSLPVVAAADARDAGGPVVVAVDDVDRADARTQGRVAEAAQLAAELPIALIVTTPVAGLDDGTRRILAAPALELIELHDLTRRGAAALLARAGRQLRPESLDAFYAATRGTPALIAALAREELAEACPTWTPECISRAGAEAVAGWALGHLGGAAAPATRLAFAAAIAGRHFDAVDVIRIAGLDGATAGAAYDLLVARGFLCGPIGRAGFRHPLVQTVLVRAAGLADGAALHARAAAIAHAAHEPAEDIAGHLLNALPSGERWRADVLMSASTRMRRAGRWEEAETLARRALAECPGDDRSEAAVHLACALVHRAPTRAAELIEDALPDVEEPALLREALGAYVRAGAAGGDAGAVAVAVRGALGRLRDAGRHEDVVRTLAELRSAAWADPALRALLAEPGSAADATASGSSADAAMKLHDAFEALVRDGATEAPAAAALEVFARGARASGVSVDSPAFVLGIVPIVAAGALPEADALLAEAEADAAVSRAPRSAAIAACARAHVLLRRGRVTDAEAAARSARAAAEHDGVLPGPGFIGAALVAALVARGELDEAARELADALACAGVSLPERALLAEAAGELALARGDACAALADLVACGRLLDEFGCDHPALSRWRSLAARALVALRRSDEARVLADEDLGRARACATPAAIARALGGRAAVAEADERAMLLGEAVALLEDGAALRDRMALLYESGEALRIAGRRGDAQAALREALMLAEAGGAEALARSARDALIAAGARVGNGASRGVAALTPSELRVAELAAGGASNRAIAEELWVTVKTVELHLTSVYRKLGIRCRRELGPALAPPELAAVGPPPDD